MSENKNIRSIANSISRSWVLRLFIILAFIDVIVFVVVAYNLDGRAAFVSWETFYYTVEFLAVPVFVVEGVLLIIELLSGTGRVRKKLRPLHEVAQTTQRLSEAARFDEAKFHDLEDAIGRISQPDEKLTTGDRDLQGLENAVNSLLDRMRESYRQQSRFVSDASHELRTPISVIQGYVNMLDRWGKEDEKILTESIAAIKSESEHMKRLVEQLLFLARGDLGRTELKLETFSLSDMMKEVFDESIMIDSAHKYEFSDPGGVEAFGDVSMLKQTARILVENAAKYNPVGETITLKTGIDAKSVPYFAVQDAGIGISADDAPHVFERFYRADSSRTRGTGGTGLGLAIASWIVDKHGGYFEVLSREGLGTRMTVNLPRLD